MEGFVRGRGRAPSLAGGNQTAAAPDAPVTKSSLYRGLNMTYYCLIASCTIKKQEVMNNKWVQSIRENVRDMVFLLQLVRKSLAWRIVDPG